MLQSLNLRLAATISFTGLECAFLHLPTIHLLARISAQLRSVAQGRPSPPHFLRPCFRCVCETHTHLRHRTARETLRGLVKDGEKYVVHVLSVCGVSLMARSIKLSDDECVFVACGHWAACPPIHDLTIQVAVTRFTHNCRHPCEILHVHTQQCRRLT